MIAVGFDCESHPIKPGMLAPRMVCGSWADGGRAWVELRRDALPRLAKKLADQAARLVIHNATFDLLVACAEDPETFLPLVFAAYEAGRVTCTMVKQMVLDVALGMRKFRHTADGRAQKATYGLDDLVLLYEGEVLEKDNSPRLRYGLLDGVEVELWTPEERDYAVKDAVKALAIDSHQSREMVEHFGAELPNQVEQQRAAWALHLMEAWGIRAEKPYVDKFVDHCQEEIQKMRLALDGTGILKPDGSRTMAEIRRRVVESLERMSIDVPMTEPSDRFPDGQVQTDKETLETTDDPALHVLAESMTFAKHLGQWGPVLRAAQDRPVCCRYNPLAETGRTSCSGSEGQEGTNFQNPPRKGDVRPAIVPRAGWVFCSTDADTIELRAHAQNCLELLGWSRLAEIFQEQATSGGPDPHETLAATIVGVPAAELQARVRAGEQEAADARQFAKIPNYGFPGGLGAETFVAYAAGQMSKEQFLRWFGETRAQRIRFARQVRNGWFETLPENVEYLGDRQNDVEGIVERMLRENDGRVRQLMSGRVRGDVRYAAACNGFFQGRVADAMKEVLWVLASECYLGKRYGSSARSPLGGCRPSMFLHDEPIVEMPESIAGEAAARQQEIMVQVLNRWMPDVPCFSTAVLMRRWQKGCKPVKVNGLLVPSRPEKGADGKVRWVEDVRLAA